MRRGWGRAARAVTVGALLVEQADRVALAIAVAVMGARSWKRAGLRPLALCLCLILDLDCARDGAPRWLDVALYAASTSPKPSRWPSGSG